MNIKLEMFESDIVRSIKNSKNSPLQLLASRHFKEDARNIEIDYDSIIIWNDDINDYHSYKYCVEDIGKVKDFLDEWHDFADGILTDFTLDPISFCVEEKHG